MKTRKYWEEYEREKKFISEHYTLTDGEYSDAIKGLVKELDARPELFEAEETESE